MIDFTCRRSVAFSDTDAAGVVHFARILTYVEDAEHDWLKSEGYDVGDTMMWPRVKVECEYSHPLRYADEVQISLQLEKRGTSSLSYHFQVGQAAQGRMVIVRLDANGDTLPFE